MKTIVTPRSFAALPQALEVPLFALLGMLVSSPEAANGVGFTLIFPITFISNVFVPPQTLPDILSREPGIQ